MSLIERAAQITNGAMILADWLGSGGHVVAKDLAQSRADVCLKCPKHAANYPIAEKAAIAIKSQLELKNHLNLRIDGEKALHACSVCGCSMRLKIWIPIERIKPQPGEEFDTNCWLLKESK